MHSQWQRAACMLAWPALPRTLQVAHPLTNMLTAKATNWHAIKLQIGGAAVVIRSMIVIAFVQQRVLAGTESSHVLVTGIRFTGRPRTKCEPWFCLHIFPYSKGKPNGVRLGFSKGVRCAQKAPLFGSYHRLAPCLGVIWFWAHMSSRTRGTPPPSITLDLWEHIKKEILVKGCTLQDDRDLRQKQFGYEREEKQGEATLCKQDLLDRWLARSGCVTIVISAV